MHTTTRGRMLLRAASVVAAVGLAAAGLTACAGGGGAQEGSATKGTVNWWGWTPDVSVAKNYIAEFNKKYPDIKVNYKMIAIDDYEAALRPALASPSGPDIFDLQPGTRVTAFKGFAEDLTPVAKDALGADWKSKVSQQGIDGLTADGKLTSLSIGAVYAGNLWINKGLFDKYGVKVPTTIDEWKQACATFKKNNVGCFVQGAAGEGFDQDTLQAIADSIEPGLFTAAEQQKKKWNDPNMVKAFTIWKELFDDGIMQPGAIGYQQYPDANNDFLTGKYAMVMMGTWYMQYATKSGLNSALSAAGVSNPTPFPVIPVPFPKAGEHDAPMFGDADYGLAIAKKSKNLKAAETFVKWLTLSQDGQQLVANTLNDIPALKSATPDWDNIELVDKAQQEQPLKDLIQRSSDSKTTRFLYVVQDVSDGILKAATGVADGSVSPKDALDQLQKTAEAAQ